MSAYLKAAMAHRQALVATTSVEHAIREGYPQSVIDARVEALAEALTRYGKYGVR